MNVEAQEALDQLAQAWRRMPAGGSFLKEERPTLELQWRGKAEEVAATIVYLCSTQASFINGANFRVNGGSVAYRLSGPNIAPVVSGATVSHTKSDKDLI